MDNVNKIVFGSSMDIDRVVLMRLIGALSTSRSMKSSDSGGLYCCACTHSIMIGHVKYVKTRGKMKAEHHLQAD